MQKTAGRDGSLYLIRLGFVPLLVVGTDLRVLTAREQEREEERRETRWGEEGETDMSDVRKQNIYRVIRVKSHSVSTFSPVTDFHATQTKETAEDVYPFTLQIFVPVTDLRSLNVGCVGSPSPG